MKKNKEYIMINKKYFSLRWFIDYGDWFFYIGLFGFEIRFSSAGFMYYNLNKKNKRND
jgi:hypothetical protein